MRLTWSLTSSSNPVKFGKPRIQALPSADQHRPHLVGGLPGGRLVTARDGIARLARQLMAGSIRRAAVACAEELIGGTGDRCPYRL